MNSPRTTAVVVSFALVIALVLAWMLGTLQRIGDQAGVWLRVLAEALQ